MEGKPEKTPRLAQKKKEQKERAKSSDLKDVTSPLRLGWNGLQNGQKKLHIHPQPGRIRFISDGISLYNHDDIQSDHRQREQPLE